jgi:predicted transcriptional regulator
MSDIQEKILELMDLFDDDEVTTANKIPRPQSSLDKEAFDDFNIRNPLAGGGMLVQPSADGRRPGYSIASEKVINFAKQFKEKNKDLPTQQEIMKGTGAGSSTIKRHLKEGVDFKKVLSPKETGAIGGKKSGEKSIAESGVIASDDKEGLKKLQTKVNKLNRVNNLKNKGIKFNIVKTKTGNYQTILSYLADTYREKLNKTKSTGSLEKLIKEFNEFRKTSLFKNYDKGTVMREAGIKSAKKQLENIGSRKLDVFEYLLNNKNATMEEIGKALKIKSGVVRKSLQGLYTDIYKRAADQGAVFLKNYNINQLDSVHDSIKNTEVPLKDRVKNLVIDAYKGDKNLKPILKKLDDFYALNKKIKKTQYGKFFAANLDHVVPLNFLRQLEEGADPFNLIKLRPVPEFLNQRAFKAQFDKALGQAYANRLKPGGKEALETIVNLQSYLPKEFGGITPDGKIINYGAKPFSLKTDLSQSNFSDIYKRVFEFIKNPELQETFKQSKVSFKNLLSQEKNIMKQSQSFNALLEKLGCGKSAGGRILKSTGGPTQCALAGKQKLENIILKGGAKGKELDLAKTILRAGGGIKSMLSLRGALGPAALAFTAATEAGLVGYDMLAKGQTFREAVGDSLFNYALGDKTKIDPRSERYKSYQAAGVDQNTLGKIAAFENAMDEVQYIQQEFDKEGRLADSILSGRGKGRMSDAMQQKQTQNYFDQRDSNRLLLQDLQRTQSRDRMDDALDPVVPFMIADADAKRKAFQLTQPRTKAFGDFMDVVFPSGFFSDTTFQEDRDRAVNYIPNVQEYRRGNQFQFADGGLSGGDKSGPPPESGPTPHGLPGILKRAKNI